MPLSDIITRLFGSEEDPVLDLNSNDDARRRLLAQSHRGAEMRPVVVVPSDGHFEAEADAAAFERAVGRRYGITELTWDRISLERVDALLDAVRSVGPHTFDPQMRQRASAWVAEWVRHVHGLRRAPDGTMTDGRVAYDPMTRIEARIVSDESPSLVESIDAALSAIDVSIRNAA
jgi:hypothetical protein